jgi:hypothetical protein
MCHPAALSGLSGRLEWGVMTVGLFGRGKNDSSGPVCASCGRTLLAGERTQKVVDDGVEQLICSLCGREVAGEVSHAHVVTGAASASSSRTREARSESDAFWRALKEKDAEIERLEARLARVEAERQELAGQLALLRERAGTEPAHGAESDAAEADGWAASDEAPPAGGDFDAGQTGEPAAAAAASAEVEPSSETTAAAGLAAVEAGEDERPSEAREDEHLAAAHEADVSFPSTLGEETAPMPALDAEPGAEAVVAAATAASALNAEAPATPERMPGAGAATGDELGEGEAPATAAAEATVEADAASLTLLQRGVDLLNVSPVPRKVAETNADLGIPQVHAGFLGDVVAVTFLWPLGWYRFTVDLEGAGAVRLDERGYDDRPELQPNASVRADGTVQLAPAQLSKAARGQETQREGAPDEEAPATRTPREVAERPPEIVSQSLLGQRTDDEGASWEQTQARDFHW